jgi:hypothetical protein
MRTHAAVEVAWQIRNGHTEKLGNGSFAYLPSANPRKIIVEAIPTKSHRLPTALPKGKTRLAPSTSIVAPTAPLMTSAQLIECFPEDRAPTIMELAKSRKVPVPPGCLASAFENRRNWPGSAIMGAHRPNPNAKAWPSDRLRNPDQLTSCADRPLLRRRSCANLNLGLYPRMDERRGSQHPFCIPIR